MSKVQDVMPYNSKFMYNKMDLEGLHCILGNLTPQLLDENITNDKK